MNLQTQFDQSNLTLPGPSGRFVLPQAVRRLTLLQAQTDTTDPATLAQLAADVASLIDHTLLKADAAEDAIRALCDEARTYHFASVCINPHWVALCTELLAGTEVKVCTVIGFPLGATSTAAKVCETQTACADGATEVDMVLNIGALKGRQLETVAADIAAVAITAHDNNALLKVIFETVLLTDDEKMQAAWIALQAGADYVKTSTGFSTGGATLADVSLMRQIVGEQAGVKASGGVKDVAGALAMIQAGASRIGASAGKTIVDQILRGTWQASAPSSSPY